MLGAALCHALIFAPLRASFVAHHSITDVFWRRVRPAARAWRIEGGVTVRQHHQSRGEAKVLPLDLMAQAIPMLSCHELVVLADRLIDAIDSAEGDTDRCAYLFLTNGVSVNQSSACYTDQAAFNHTPAVASLCLEVKMKIVDLQIRIARKMASGKGAMQITQTDLDVLVHSGAYAALCEAATNELKERCSRSVVENKTFLKIAPVSNLGSDVPEEVASEIARVNAVLKMPVRARSTAPILRDLIKIGDRN